MSFKLLPGVSAGGSFRVVRLFPGLQVSVSIVGFSRYGLADISPMQSGRITLRDW